jgi:hypothetical protein
MTKKDLPDFPFLLKTIGDFLREAEVPKRQQKKLMMARGAFDILCKTIYPRTAKPYPCFKTPYIQPMPPGRLYPCLKRAYLSPFPSSRAAK